MVLISSDYTCTIIAVILLQLFFIIRKREKNVNWLIRSIFYYFLCLLWFFLRFFLFFLLKGKKTETFFFIHEFFAPKKYKAKQFFSRLQWDDIGTIFFMWILIFCHWRNFVNLANSFRIFFNWSCLFRTRKLFNINMKLMWILM